MDISYHSVDNGEGWRLQVKQYVAPAQFDPNLRPLVMIPGYCMNTFILGFHPSDVSMVEHLARAGFEVWTANLRAQGDSQCISGDYRIGFRELALVDVPKVLDHIVARTKSNVKQVDLIGSSLGGSILFCYLAHHPHDERIGGLVGIGAPLRWDDAHPLLKFAFRSPRIAGIIPIAGTRRFARSAVGVIRRVPWLLSIYMNPSQIDLSQAQEITKTVDDPIRHLNKQIAHWFLQKDMVVDGLNVTEGMSQVEVPMLLIFANADGIVPLEAARSVLRAVGSRDVTELLVGDDEIWMAHADMFISHKAKERVFEPMARWLLDHN